MHQFDDRQFAEGLRTGQRHGPRGLAALLGAALLATACDLTVENAGPIDDTFMDTRLAHAAMVNGAERYLAVALGFHAVTIGGVTREVNAAGNVCSFGITALQTVGILGSEDWEEYCSSTWTTPHVARWAAEDGIRRMRATLGAEFGSSPLAARMLLAVGYSNRLLGDNMCFAVIDGGPAEPNTVHWDRAEAAFTEALAVASQAGQQPLELAALAGRASVRVGLGNWAGAVADANGVPSSFTHQARYFTTTQPENNRVWRTVSNSPARTTTVWNTHYLDYYTKNQDPRTPWGENPAIPYGDAAVGGYGRVPWKFQRKFPSAAAPINLSSGHEMRLIEAEALLRAGNWQAAMGIINQRRAQVGVPQWTAANATEAWSHLKRERGIELWLEARRLADLRRWRADNTPGDLHPLEVIGGEILISPQRSYCAPISIREILANPNLHG